MKTLLPVFVPIVVLFLLVCGCASQAPAAKEVTPTSIPTATHILNPPVTGTPMIVTTMVITSLPTPEENFEVVREATSGVFRILKYHEERPAVGQLIIVGTAKNEAKNPVFNPEVIVRFYDADGRQVASTKDTTDKLAPGEVWNFQVMYPGDDSRKAKSYTVTVNAN
jgi:hypothetical protein